MRKDLIERLRNFENSDELGNGDFSILHEAAALEAARGEVERLTGCLPQPTRTTSSSSASGISSGIASSGWRRLCGNW